MEWQPIETAPKDGTRIIVCRKSTNKYIPMVGEDRWGEFGGAHCWARSNSETEPTHWMPLPQPPETKP